MGCNREMEPGACSLLTPLLPMPPGSGADPALWNSLWNSSITCGQEGRSLHPWSLRHRRTGFTSLIASRTFPNTIPCSSQKSTGTLAGEGLLYRWRRCPCCVTPEAPSSHSRARDSLLLLSSSDAASSDTTPRKATVTCPDPRESTGLPVCKRAIRSILFGLFLDLQGMCPSCAHSQEKRNLLDVFRILNEHLVLKPGGK